jgi:uncharacterized protein (DUF2062 family)
MFTTLYTNPFTFVPLYILAYSIGRLVTGDSAPLALPRDIHWTFSGLWDYLGELVHWTASLGDTLLIGLAIQLAVFSVLGYFATLVIWRGAVTWAWRRRSRLRAARAPA